MQWWFKPSRNVPLTLVHFAEWPQCVKIETHGSLKASVAVHYPHSAFQHSSAALACVHISPIYSVEMIQTKAGVGFAIGSSSWHAWSYLYPAVLYIFI